MEANVEEREPTSSRKRAQFGKVGGRQNSSPNGNPLEACTPVVFDGWNIHHTNLRGTWIRQSSVIFKNSQFSDNPKAFIYPTSDCPGQFQTIQARLKKYFFHIDFNPSNPNSVKCVDSDLRQIRPFRPFRRETVVARDRETVKCCE